MARNEGFGAGLVPRKVVWAALTAGLLGAAALSVQAGDTGQLGCQDAISGTGTVGEDGADPEAPGFDGQDCTRGSAAAQALGVGFAQGIAAGGGDWSKIGSAGEVLADDAPSWVCLRDNLTGLIWEMKTADAGLHGRAHRYTWRSTDAASNGGNPGSVGGDSCAGTLPDAQCNTQALVEQVNAAGLCGANDWRLPSIVELESIVDLGNAPRPSINQTLFLGTTEDESVGYWSSSSSAVNSNGAWVIVFDGGRRVPLTKATDQAVRLVRTAP